MVWSWQCDQSFALYTGAIPKSFSKRSVALLARGIPMAHLPPMGEMATDLGERFDLAPQFLQSTCFVL